MFILLILAAASVRALGFDKPQITLSGQENLIVLEGQMITPIVDTVKNALLSAGPNPILWINSPGGEIFSGMGLVDIVQSRGDVTCYATQAGSMAFALLQACKERVVVGSVPVLMQHPPQLMLEGQQDVNSLIKLITQIVLPLEAIMVKLQATRLGLTEAEFRKKIEVSWQLTGPEEILKNKAADRAVNVRCTLAATKKLRKNLELQQTPFGASVSYVNVSWCPLTVNEIPEITSK
jgi:ATP-dependent protease ClpP protease subunit